MKLKSLTSCDFRFSLIKSLFLLIAIAYPAGSVVITCDFREESYSIGHNSSTLYICDVKIIENSEIREVTEILGNHLSGRSHNDVESFDLHYSSRYFNLFPRNIERFFPNLIAILSFNSQMTSISAKDLAPWPNLIYFNAYNNALQTLDGDLFQHTPKLKSIVLSNNRILYVGANLLANLKNLENFGFGNNLCYSGWAHSPEQIADMKLRLAQICEPPQTTTTEPVQCSARCSINEEVDYLQAKIEDQSKEISQQIVLNKQILERVAALEKQIGEVPSK